MNDFYLILITVILSYLLAQFFKIFTHKNLSLKNFLFGTGGMPSAHTSAVVSLPIILFLTQGITPLLAVSIIFSILVIRDAIGVRYAVGENAKILKKKFPNEKIIISEGHTLKQVLFGAMLGVIIAVVVFLIW